MKRFVSVISGLVLAAFFFGTALAETPDGIRERGVLRVGTAGDYQPMSYLDPETGKYVGFDAELAEDLAAVLGVDIEYVPTSWPTLTEDTLAGKFDLAICGITVTDARKEAALICPTGILRTERRCFAGRKTPENTSAWRRLIGRKCG